MQTSVAEQSYSDLLPERTAVVTAQRFLARDLNDAETLQAFDAQHRAPTSTGVRCQRLRKDDQPPDPAAELDAAVEDAIEACGGDLLATIRALIVANSMLERSWLTSTRLRHTAI
jgi:hypothetical protein